MVSRVTGKRRTYRGIVRREILNPTERNRDGVTICNKKRMGFCRVGLTAIIEFARRESIALYSRPCAGPRERIIFPPGRPDDGYTRPYRFFFLHSRSVFYSTQSVMYARTYGNYYYTRRLRAIIFQHLFVMYIIYGIVIGQLFNFFPPFPPPPSPSPRSLYGPAYRRGTLRVRRRFTR